MTSFNKLLTITLMTLLNLPSFAAKSYPRGCEVKGFGYSENHLVLNETGEQTLYLIQNTSNATIELQRHETQDVFMSPTLQAHLSSEQWAAFASDVQNLNFSCYAIQNGNSALVDCSDVLDVCQYPRVKFALSNMGNYWVSVNKSQTRIINDAIAKGILLRW